MSAHERAVHWVTERIDGADAAFRNDVALTTCELCREAGRSRRALELANLFGMALRLRSRARTGDRPDAVWRQGVEIGAVVLLSSLAARSAAGGLASGGSFGLAVILGASAVCALLRRRLAAVGLAAGAAIVEGLWVGHGAQAGVLVSGCAVAIGGLLARGPATRRPRSGMAFAPVAATLGGLLAALAIGPTSAESATVLSFAWIAPLALLSAGGLDPRLAAAATTVVFARLLASGFGELGRALAVLQQAGQRELLLRWLAMSAAVVGAWLVTHRSIRQVARL